MRALVLGGGGLTGVAWLWGIIAGLADGGVDLADADLVIGTSAGSVVGAQLATRVDPRESFTRQLAGPGSEVAARVRPITMAQLVWAVVRTRSAEQARRNIGQVALAARTVPAATRREVIAARLPVHSWPDRRLSITAVDVDSGERVAFDRTAGVDLVDAVAASCAVPGVWPPVPIDGRRYIDGGICSLANADLAAGADRVVILAPLVRGVGPITGVAAQAVALRRHARVVVVQPDGAAVKAIGRNVLDPVRRAPAARAGCAQARSCIAQIDQVWSG
jgi:NTE family protein